MVLKLFSFMVKEIAALDIFIICFFRLCVFKTSQRRIKDVKRIIPIVALLSFGTSLVFRFSFENSTYSTCSISIAFASSRSIKDRCFKAFNLGSNIDVPIISIANPWKRDKILGNVTNICLVNPYV